MANRLIFNAFAYEESCKSGANISAVSDKHTVYMQNLSVSLISAKIHNPEDTVALVTNTTPPESFAALLDKHGVEIFLEPFDTFRFPGDYPWALAFYKLCAMEKMLARGFEKCLLLDTDTYVQSAVSDLWTDTEYFLLLYDINHRLQILNCEKFNEELQRFGWITPYRPITNYGGEFLAGNRENLSLFMQECTAIYHRMCELDFRTTRGDEFISRQAAEHLKPLVKNAGGYVYRFWTGSFYLVSTCYKYNPVSVLHVPDEKNRGMLKLYAYIRKHGTLPPQKTVWKLLHLTHPRWLHVLRSMIRK